MTNFGNTFFVNNFNYQINEQSFKGTNTKFIDKEKNDIYFIYLRRS